MFKFVILFKRTHLISKTSSLKQFRALITFAKLAFKPHSSCVTVGTVSVQEVDDEKEEDHTNQYCCPGEDVIVWLGTKSMIRGFLEKMHDLTLSPDLSLSQKTSWIFVRNLKNFTLQRSYQIGTF